MNLHCGGKWRAGCKQRQRTRKLTLSLHLNERGGGAAGRRNGKVDEVDTVILRRIAVRRRFSGVGFEVLGRRRCDGALVELSTGAGL